jgi:hypothetical protein
MLTDEEMLNIKMMSIHLCGDISRANYDCMRHAFHKQLKCYTLFKVQSRLATLSGISSVVYDCCCNNCMAFTGPHASDTDCRFCGASCYSAKGKTIAQWETIPLIPQLQDFFSDKTMAKSMQYQHQYVQHEGLVKDVFDSEYYKRLCKKNVVIDGVATGCKYFQGEHDIVLSLLGDGVQLFEQGLCSLDTCWPIILQNLNLPPEECCKLHNVLAVAIIPGLNQPKDFNSFFHPFVKEVIQLAGRGATAYDVLTKKEFALHACPIIVSGDMQAIKHFGGMKGSNFKVPCHACRVTGVYDSVRKTHYVPLAHPIIPGPPLEFLSSYNPQNLPLHTSEGIKHQMERITLAPTKTPHTNLPQTMACLTPLYSTISPPFSTLTHIPMSLCIYFYSTMVPTMSPCGLTITTVSLGMEDYMIPAADWAEIGCETFLASQTIPAAFTWVLPNIAMDCWFYNAEPWAFWLQFISPVVLNGQLPKKFYTHYMDLVWILKTLLALSITSQQIKELQKRVVHYVEQFEE